MRSVVARNLEGRGINVHPKTTIKEVLKISLIMSLAFIFLQILVHRCSVLNLLIEYFFHFVAYDHMPMLISINSVD